MKYIAAALMLTAISPALAQDGIRAQLGSCLAIPGVLQRLSCYDAIAKGTGLVAPAPRAPLPATVAPAQAYAPPLPARPVAQAGGFGAERLPQSAAAAQQRARGIVSEIVRFDTTAHGKFILTLANGQVWKQLDGDDAVSRPRKTARTATIENAIFGSYVLSFNDSARGFKVTRIQ